jgi:hypothetical protein
MCFPASLTFGFTVSVMEQGCKARHPWTASGAHGEPKLGGMAFEFRNQNGAVVDKLCAGKPYAFTVSAKQYALAYCTSMLLTTTSELASDRVRCVCVTHPVHDVPGCLQ